MTISTLTWCCVEKKGEGKSLGPGGIQTHNLRVARLVLDFCAATTAQINDTYKICYFVNFAITVKRLILFNAFHQNALLHCCSVFRLKVMVPTSEARRQLLGWCFAEADVRRTTFRRILGQIKPTFLKSFWRVKILVIERLKAQKLEPKSSRCNVL